MPDNTGHKPNTADKPIGLVFASGFIRRNVTADKYRWSLTGCEWDIKAWQLAK